MKKGERNAIVDAVVARYGGAVLQFDGYHKYEFSFKGTLGDGTAVALRGGGRPDDIYGVAVGPTGTLRELVEEFGRGECAVDVVAGGVTAASFDKEMWCEDDD